MFRSLVQRYKQGYIHNIFNFGVKWLRSEHLRGMIFIHENDFCYN